jgi:23S rRNA pseudouridine2605 synthase
LIRIAYGDYKLDTIPPGMAIPVPYKPITTQKARGSLSGSGDNRKRRAAGKESKEEEKASPVRWVTSVQ